MLFGLIGCRNSEDPHVVLYASADDFLARRIVDAFEEETGIRISLVGDSEAQKTTGLVQRLRAERDHPQADVFWSSEIMMTIALAEEGVLASYQSATTEPWPAQYKDSEGKWFAFAGRARVIVYAKDRVRQDEIPAAWTDLTQRRYQGRIVMADPRFGTTGGHLAAMKAYWDHRVSPGYYQAFLLGLRDNGARILPSGNAGVVRAVMEGEADFGLTDTDDVWAAQRNGWEVDLVYPRHDLEDMRGGGTFLMPNSVALVAGAGHPREAGMLIEFLLSEEVERMIAESDSHNIPLRPGLSESYPEYAVPDPMRVDLDRAATLHQESVAEAMKLLVPPATNENP